MKKIPLTGGHVALVDDKDYEALSEYKWYTQIGSSGPRAVRTICLSDGKQITILLSRQIMDAPPGMDVDHQDHNTLNDQKENLRVCTRSQNQANRRKGPNLSSKFKGVCWDRVRKKWKAQITIGGQYMYLGLFDSEEEAACAYDNEAEEAWGEFALMNNV